MFLSGVHPPKLGSIQDRVLRRYQVLESRKELQKTKLLTQIAIGMGGAGNQPWFNEIQSIWSEYVNLECGIVSVVEDRERKMREDYETFRYLRPKATITKDGRIEVTGAIPKTFTKK